MQAYDVGKYQDALCRVGIWGTTNLDIYNSEEVYMSLNVTDLAVTKLKEYLSQNNIESALRVALMQGGWSGPSLGLALDEPKENDKVYDQSELTFLVEDSLLETCGAINVEYIEAGPRSGFGISSTNPIGGGGCSPGSCGSGSCG